MPRVAWFSPLPPVRSGVSSYSAELLPLLRRRFDIDVFDESRAHNFVWNHGNHPYDLIVYQLGNSLCHEYEWGYFTRYPGLIVLHDAQLHQSRALSLLRRQRHLDYRHELAFSHPDVPPGLADLIITGLGGSLYYLWPMLRLVMTAARLVAVHNDHLARELRECFPGVLIDAIRMGVPAVRADATARDAVRARHQIPAGAMVFACYGKVTPEKRIGPVLRTLARIRRLHPTAHLLLVGESGDDYDVLHEARELGVEDRVRLAGFVEDAELPAYVEATDVCLCLRWPTSGETSASWLRCLAAGRPTVVTNLVQVARVPHLDSRDNAAAEEDAMCVSVDVLDEDRSVELAMNRLAADGALRERLGARARAYWQQEHTLERMVEEYERLIARAMDTPLPKMSDLPPHVRDDGTGLARRLTRQFGVTVDFLSA